MAYACVVIALLRPLLAIAFFGLWVYCIVDVIRAPQEAVRYVHKLVWLAVVILLNPVGGLAWLFLGRPDPVGSRLVGPPRPAPQVAPDDSPDFLQQLDDQIKRKKRADELRRGPDIDPEVVDGEIERLEREFGEDDPEAPPASS